MKFAPLGITQFRRKKAFQNVAAMCLQLVQWFKVAHDLQNITTSSSMQGQAGLSMVDSPQREEYRKAVDRDLCSPQQPPDVACSIVICGNN